MQASVLPPGTCVCPADFLPLGMNPLASEVLHAEHCGLRNPLGSIVIIPLTEGGPHSPSLPLHLSPAEKPRFVLVYLAQHSDRNKKCVRECRCFSRVGLYATPWTVACQAPLSIEFFKQECHFLLQGIFPTQGLDPHLLHFLPCRQILLPLSH